MSVKQINVPDIGEYSDVDVIEVLVSVGDQIAVEDSIVTLETDKATMEIPSPAAGVVKEIVVKEGDKVSEGSLLIQLEAEGADSAESDSAEVEVPATPAQSEPTEAQAAGSAVIEPVVVPDIGEYSDVDVIEVHIKVGDQIDLEAPLVTLETDKATMEIPAAAAGTITEVKVKEGDKVSQGDVIASLQSASASDAGQPDQSTDQQEPELASTTEDIGQSKQGMAQQKSETVSATEDADGTSQSTAHASPAIRRLARELGVDLSQVTATGRKGRVLEDDVKKHVKAVMQGQGAAGTAGAGLGLLPDPVVDFAKFGEIETKTLPRIKKISGANLARNWIKVPHITFFEDADITDLETFRKDKKAAAEKAGVKLTPVPFIVKAVAKALTEFANVNSSLSSDGNSQVFKQYVHVGVAVDTPNGLMVPVIRDANKKSIYQIAADLIELSGKARQGKLASADMQGGCFTISSLGGIGTTGFMPIVNMPEAAILGVSKAAIKPVYDGADFVPRLMLPLSLSADHRLVDGAEAAQFLVAVAKYLSDLRELIL